VILKEPPSPDTDSPDIYTAFCAFCDHCADYISRLEAKVDAPLLGVMCSISDGLSVAWQEEYVLPSLPKIICDLIATLSLG